MTGADPIGADRPAIARRRLFIAAGLLAGLLWLIWAVRFRPWVAHNDFAVMRVSLERMLDGHVPTVGTYSRLGVYHPGPLREWVFAIPYALGGGRASTLPATALLLNLGWVVACGWIGLRCVTGGCRIAVMAGATLLVIGLGPNLASPWNPHLAILAMYVACWSVTLLWRGGCPNPQIALLAVASASFAGQMHASALPAAGLLLIAAVALPVLRPRVGWSAGGPLVLGLVLWSGVLIDLGHLGSSNLVNLAQAGSGSTLGVGNAFGLVSRLLWPPTGVTGLSIRPSAESLIGFSRVWVVVLVAALAATAATAFYRRSVAVGVVQEPDASGRDQVDLGVVSRAGVVALAMLVVAVLTIALFAPPPFRYLFGPLQAVAVFAFAALVIWPVHEVWRRLPEPAGMIAFVAFVGVCVAMFLVVPIDDHESAARRALGVDTVVERFLDEHPDWSTIHVTGLDMVGASAQDEVAVVAYRAGRDVRSRQFGLHLPPPSGSEPVLAVAMGDSLTCLAIDPTASTLLSGVIGESAVGIFGLDALAAQESECLVDLLDP